MAAETGLPSRYEIRVLGPEHVEWAGAIVMHSNVFFSSVWPVVYPDDKAARAYDGLNNVNYLVRHQIDSGYSLGVFDKDYQFKRHESIATGGKLYWDDSDREAGADTLLEQMDFPLVSVALAYDSFNPLDAAKMKGLIRVFPLYGTYFGTLHRLDKRDPSSWKAKGPGEVLFRNATSTRHDYEGKGLMKKMAHYMMHTMATKGFRGIQIESLSDAVVHVWAHPPSPFASQIVAEFRTRNFQDVNESGEIIYPFKPADQKATKIYCTLKVD